MNNLLSYSVRYVFVYYILNCPAFYAENFSNEYYIHTSMEIVTQRQQVVNWDKNIMLSMTIFLSQNDRENIYT